MNEFERAQARTEKREQRKTLALPKAAELNADWPGIETPVAAIEVPVPKEKRPSIDAVIKVIVTLPYETFELSFTKANVMGMKRLTRADFQKTLSEGLRPLLGNLK